MKIALSGSRGFIGTNMSERLKQLGHSVIPISQETLYKFESLQKFFLKHKPDVIIHAAAYGNQGKTKGQTEPGTIVACNVGCTYNMLEASLPIPYKCFLNIGSSSEYGDKTRPMSETDLPEADTFYGVTKLAGTYLAKAFAKEYKKPIITVRPFSVYGDHEGDWRFIPTVIRSIMKRTTFPLEEDATHDWIYVKDFVNACIRLFDKPELTGQIVNVGTGKSYSNKLIVEMLETLLDKRAKYISTTGLRPGHSFFWEADIHKLQTFFKPSYDIADGLAETVKFYRKKYK